MTGDHPAALKASCAAPANASPASGDTAAALSPRVRAWASAGAAPSSSSASSPVQAGASRSGSPCSAVAIALAWISGPGHQLVVGRRGRVDVLQRGGGRADDDDAAAQALGSALPETRSENETVGTVPRGPA